MTQQESSSTDMAPTAETAVCSPTSPSPTNSAELRIDAAGPLGLEFKELQFPYEVIRIHDGGAKKSCRGSGDSFKSTFSCAASMEFYRKHPHSQRVDGMDSLKSGCAHVAESLTEGSAPQVQS